MDYRSSGVDIDAGHEVVKRIKSLARGTFTPGVLSEIGSFGGLFTLEPARSDAPVLVASADGVGTKLKVAFRANRHDTIGEDLVNHCVNDILVHGARPIGFLDYFATGLLDTAVAEAVVSGVARGCRAHGMPLMGGETAEMPDVYREGDYDLAGFLVGVVDRPRLVDGRTIEPGDVLIGLRSSGLHTNGYSLARRIVFDHLGLEVDTVVTELGCSIGEVLLEPHRSYLRVVQPLLSLGSVKGMAHITGGGITDNLPRVLPPGRAAEISRSAWPVPSVFRFLQAAGQVPDDDMFRTFNMGIGLILVVAERQVQGVIDRLTRAGEEGAAVIGRIVAGEPGVRYV